MQQHSVCRMKDDIWVAVLRCPETGSMWSDGRISIGQCDLVESWDNLSLSQKKNLNYRYQMGCECRVSKSCSFPIHTYLSSVPLYLWERRLKKQNNGAHNAKKVTSQLIWCKIFFPFFYKTMASLLWAFYPSDFPYHKSHIIHNIGEANFWSNKWTKDSFLLRSTPVTQCRVHPQEKTSACGLTGCWTTV